MKPLKLLVVFFLSSFLLAIAPSCNQGKTGQKEESAEQAKELKQTGDDGYEHTAMYVCPMHCEGSGSDAAGACPVCGMDYVLNEKHKKNGHQHDHDHSHDHDHEHNHDH